MIVVDTAVWIDHFRDGDPHLAGLLDRGLVLGHPWVTAQLATGSIRNRLEILRLLDDLPQATDASATEIREFVERHELFGAGIGYVDAQLLAATMLSTDATLWTRDRRLHAPARRLGLAYAPSQTHGATPAFCARCERGPATLGSTRKRTRPPQRSNGAFVGVRPTNAPLDRISRTLALRDELEHRYVESSRRTRYFDTPPASSPECEAAECDRNPVARQRCALPLVDGSERRRALSQWDDP